ncbi:MAG: hypothetical protein UR26_C0003G0144 [candidate division TM6 bacterium GW2011_GWF2_32_72]|nr:MAG: hypothetical protein UR26_C0003G0144 [candidate division TM6 bacterium GW2011_GWF2_32_72]
MQSCLASEPKLVLRALDANGRATKKFSIGVPFILNVSISGVEKDVERPVIESLENYKYSFGGSSSSINIINGHTTSKRDFQYQIRIDQEGEHNLGPAKISWDGKIISSNVLTLNVGSVTSTLDQENGAPYFLEQTVENIERFVGERLPFAIRFYFLEGAAKLENIENPTFQGFDVKKVGNPTYGVEEKNGTEYNFIQFSYDLYPQLSGEIVIPSIRASTLIQEKHRRSPFDFFGDLETILGGMGRSKIVTSNALKIQVKPLPPFNGKVLGVGNFSNFKSSIDHSSAKEGEGIVLTLEIVGNGNMDSLNLSDLNLPKEFRFYESKNYLSGGILKDGSQKKVFEYIVQGLQPGDFEIPIQKFTYFDVEKKAYNVLKTSPIKIKILPGGIKSVVVEEKAGDEQEVFHGAVDQDEIEGINKVGPWELKKERQIPWFWFVFMCFLPFLILILNWLYNLIRSWAMKSEPYIRKRNAFSRAQRFLKSIKKDEDFKKLYFMFVDLIASRAELPENQLTTDFIETYFSKAAFSEKELSDWNDFFIKITELNFFPRTLSEEDKKSLLLSSEKWLNILSKKL